MKVMGKNDFLIGRIEFDDSKIDFPKEFSREEERAVFYEYKKTGSRKLEEELAYRNIMFVYKIVRKYYKNSQMQDAFSAGLLGLTKAIRTYDPDNASSFKNYAFTVISNAIAEECRFQKTFTKYDLFGDAVFVDKNGNEIIIEELLHDDDDVENMVIEKDRKEREIGLQREIFDIANKRLSETQLRAFSGCFGVFGKEKRCQRLVAQEMGYSRSYVTRLANIGLEKIQKDCVGELNQRAYDLGYLQAKDCLRAANAVNSGRQVRKARKREDVAVFEQSVVVKEEGVATLTGNGKDNQCEKIRASEEAKADIVTTSDKDYYIENYKDIEEFWSDGVDFEMTM